MLERKDYFGMLLRWLRITKPIELSPEEVLWIKMCKGHYFEGGLWKGGGNRNYPSTGEWTDTMKPLFKELYGWNPDQYYDMYLHCLFNKLLEIWLKIRHTESAHNPQLEQIFRAAFDKGCFRDQETPIERAIAELCAQIQGTIVYRRGIYRFYLPDDQPQNTQ